MKKAKGLGRGLEALLGPQMAVRPGQEQDFGPDDRPAELALGQLVAGTYQPRTRMDEGALYELAESIKSQGIMQPILVRPIASSQEGVAHYEIIAGERRFRAAKLAGLERVPVLVRDVQDQAAAAMALIENIQREDLNPLEEAQGMQRLIKEFGLTHDQVGQILGKSRSATSNLLRLLNLADPVQTMLMAGDLDMGHARALLVLEKPAQIAAAQQIHGKNLSVREAEALVKKLGKEFVLTPSRPNKEKSRDIKRVEEELADLLTAPVEIIYKKVVKRNGKTIEQGLVSIAFASLEALNGIVDGLRAGRNKPSA